MALKKYTEFNFNLNLLKIKDNRIIPIKKYQFGMMEDIMQILTIMSDDGNIYESIFNTSEFPSITHNDEVFVNEDDFDGYFNAQNVNWHINIINNIINGGTVENNPLDDIKLKIKKEFENGAFSKNSSNIFSTSDSIITRLFYRVLFSFFITTF